MHQINLLNLEQRVWLKFKTIMLKSSLCDYSDAYILVKGTIGVNNRCLCK